MARTSRGSRPTNSFAMKSGDHRGDVSGGFRRVVEEGRGLTPAGDPGVALDPHEDVTLGVDAAAPDDEGPAERDVGDDRFDGDDPHRRLLA